MRVIEHLVQAIRKTAEYNPAAQAAPFCILWPDKERQWEKIIPVLQAAMPELFVLGDYSPQEQKGPAIWLRCIVAGKVTGICFEKITTPVFYLPGVSRQDLRAVEQCEEFLKPLAELQYRSAFWTQVNARDWTVFAYFKARQGGLGFDVAHDRDSLQALQLALGRLLDEDIITLRQKHLDKEFFTVLLAGEDTVRDILQWLSNSEVFRAGRTSEEWQAFTEVCKSKYRFDPNNDGILTGAEKLAGHEGAWQKVWNRFCEAPAKYAVIPDLIRRTVMPLGLDPSGWPQWNEGEENRLRSELRKISDMSSQDAREQVRNLENEHGPRRESVWAEIEEAPLAMALCWLAKVAEVTKNVFAGDIKDVVADYIQSGWRADDAVTRALALVEKQEDIAAVSIAIKVMYQPWLEQSANHLQELIRSHDYPGGNCNNATNFVVEADECILFVDGLRFDLAKRLAEQCRSQGLVISENIAWAALPSVTVTCKPAVMPIRGKLYGEAGNVDFEPSIKETNQIATGPRLHKLLAESGWALLSSDSRQDETGNAWLETVSIDDEGHHRGWRMAQHVDKMLKEISDKVQALFADGWRQIRIISDHGWLLMPGGLPKVDLPVSLSETKWARCAIIKPGAMCDEHLYPWYWNPHIQIALADGISCYRTGMEYTHGGLSLQECLLLQLNIRKEDADRQVYYVTISDVVWKGMRCKVVAEGAYDGLKVDLRLQPGNPDSSVAVTPKPFNASGVASLVVEDDALERKKVTLVLIDDGGRVMAQQLTMVGGDQ